MVVIQTGPGFELNNQKTARTYLTLGNYDSLSQMEIGWVEWFAADFGELLLDQVRFTRCDLTSADFSRSTLKDVVFFECTLIGVRFPEETGSNWECIDCHDSLKTVAPWTEPVGPPWGR